MASGHFISIKDLLTQVLPVADIELPADDVLEQVKISPAAVYPDPQHGLRTETQLIVGHRFEAPVPFLPAVSIAVGGSQTPIKLNYTVQPKVNVLLGPCAVSFFWDNNLLTPVRRVTDGQRRIEFEPDPDNDRFSFQVDECWLKYSQDDGIGFDSRLVISIPPFLVNGTDLVLGVNEAAIVFAPSMFSGVLAELGFDDSFRGVFANDGVLYWLPEIQLQGFDVPGLRLDLRDLAIGNQGISFDLTLSWEVAVSDAGQILAEGTELRGSLFDDSWQLALANASGRVRRNVPEALAVRTFLRVPYFQAVFSATFAAAYRVEDDGNAAYKTSLAIAKESTDPIQVAYLDDQFQLSLDQFQASGFLSNEGFAIDGMAAFAINVFGFELSVGSAQLKYAHTAATDDFEFKMTDVTLGELGETQEARLAVKVHTDEDGDFVFDKLEIAADFAWQDLQHLIPQDLQDLVGLPEDGTVSALLTWQEVDGTEGGSRKLVVQLKTGASHLDNLWLTIPPAYRPQVRRIESMFKLSYDSVDTFVPDQAAPSGGTFVERDGVEVSLTAEIELKLPNVAAFPNFELVSIDTGDDEGFITAEFDARFSNSDAGASVDTGLTVLNPFTMDLQLPGTAAGTPFIHNEMHKIVLQFSIGEDSSSTGGDVEIGGKLACEGGFVFRPLVPAETPFANELNSLMHNVGFDEIAGTSALTLTFMEDSFDFTLAGEFEQLGIELDLFRMFSNLSSNGETPDAQEVEIDFVIGFHLIGFTFNVGYGSDDTNADEGEFHFGFDLKVECSMTGLPPVRAAISLSNEAFSFGLEDLAIPLEVPRYPIGTNDLAQLRDTGGRWSNAARLAYENAEIQPSLAAIDAEFAGDPPPARRLRLLKDKSHLELKALMLQLIMAIHQRVANTGQPTFETLVELDTAVHDAVFSLLHVETEIKLTFPEIKFRIPFDDPSGIALAGAAKLTGFSEDDPLKPLLEDFTFTLGLTSQYVFLKIESSGAPLVIPSFGTKYDDGSVSISKFAIGYGYTKNSLALDFAGELVIPTALIEDADTSAALGVGVRLPRHNKLAFKLDLIPVSIGKATIVIPLPQFDLDLRSPSAPLLIATDVCTPAWDGLEFLARDVVHADLKRLAFSPFFGMGIIPNVRFDGDIELGNAENGITIIADDTLILIALVNPIGSPPYIPIPMFVDPTAPYFENLCVNLRVAGFALNFNLQRPFPSTSPLAAIEVIGLLSDPMMEIDPNGALANTIRFSLTDGYVRVPDAVLQMFPDAANFVNRTYEFTLNLGTLITFVQSLVATGQPMLQALQDLADGSVDSVAGLLGRVDNAFDPWSWVTLLPPELRKFRTGGQLAGFEASVCLVLATAEEAFEGLQNKGAAPPALPDLTVAPPDPAATIDVPRRNSTPEFKATSGFRFASSWRPAGATEFAWTQIPGGIAVSGDADQPGYFMFERKPLPGDFSIDMNVAFGQTAGASAGAVLLDDGGGRHYALLLTRGDGALRLTLEKVSPTATETLLTRNLGTSATGAQLEITSMLSGSERRFDVAATTTATDRSRPSPVSRTVRLHTTDTSAVVDGVTFGLVALGSVGVEFSDVAAYRVKAATVGFNRPSPDSLANGFNVNLPATQFNGRRVVTRNESKSLFDGIEFRHFDEGFLNRFPVDKLLHLSEDADRIYLGAYVKVFTGQRVRFLGALYADGSFALLSEAASKPLQLSVFNVPINIPFDGYGNLILVGRQKRNGFYGFVEANGRLDWSPIPSVVRVTAGTDKELVSLTIFSSGQFALKGSGTVTLFDGAVAIVEAAVDISHERAAFAGRLNFTVPVHSTLYKRLLDNTPTTRTPRTPPPIPNLIELDVEGAGEIENLASYRFAGRGNVAILGQAFAGIDVVLANNYASFAVFFRKPADSGTALEKALPILSQCGIDLEASCTVDVRKPKRPAFELSGVGSLHVLGAEIRGRGSIVARPAIGKAAKHDFFEAKMAGALLWQGRQWLGGEIAVGSRGLKLSGTTHFGLGLTPSEIAGIDIASLFLDIKLEGEFRVDVDLGEIFFLFRGNWTLGAAMANTGNADAGHRQILPLAASEFTFTSTAGAAGSDFKLQLFSIDGFKFLPFDTITIPVPSLTVRDNATPLIRLGSTNEADLSNDANVPTVQFDLPGASVLGARATFPPEVYDQNRVDPLEWATSTDVYSPTDLRITATEHTFDATVFDGLTIYLVLQGDAAEQFPLKIVVESAIIRDSHHYEKSVS